MIPRRWLLPLALAVAAVQIGVLTFMIASRAAILRNGTEIMLRVEPVDPRDLFRGDYVTLGYNISRVPAELFEGQPGEASDTPRTVFVRLKAGDNGIWSPVAASYDAPPATAAADGEVDIRGTTHRWWRPDTAFIDVLYGIERFYVPEGEGREIENAVGTRTYDMKVAVAASGAAQIKALYDGETMLYAEPLY